MRSGRSGSAVVAVRPDELPQRLGVPGVPFLAFDKKAPGVGSGVVVQRVQQVVVGGDQVPVQFQGFSVAGDRRHPSCPLSFWTVAEIAISLTQVGPQCQGLLKAGDGLVRLSLFFPRVAQIVVAPRHNRAGSPGALVAGDGLIELAFFAQSVAQIVAGLGMVGLDRQCPLEGGDGLVQLSVVHRASPRLLWHSPMSGLIARPLVAGDGLVELVFGHPGCRDCCEPRHSRP